MRSYRLEPDPLLTLLGIAGAAATMAMSAFAGVVFGPVIGRSE